MRISLLILLLIGGGFLFAVLCALGQTARDWRKMPLKRALTRIAAVVLLIYGAIGFFGAAFSALGGLRRLPEDVRLPMWFASGTVMDQNGNYYCPSKAFGRIQVYDREREFLRGWFVEAYGGSFKIRMNGGDRLEAVTARRQKRYIFDLRGRLISEFTYGSGESYSDFEDWRGRAVVVRSPMLLIPISHPFSSWTMLILGGLLYNRSNDRKKRRPARSS